MKIWTEAYRPFIMGGDVNAPVATDIDVGEKIPIGKGYFIFLVANPITGRTHVVEERSGAFIGNTIKEVRQDVIDAPLEMMDKQVEEAIKRSKKAEIVGTDAFWKMF